nr:branched-chain amino acid ABC transporter permease [Bradyrhizobium liaoningense]
MPAILPGYLLFQVSIALTYAIAILGLNLVMGFNGQISLAQGVFFAVGGYVVAILMTTCGLSFWTSLPLAIVAATVLGTLVGIPALRLQGLQLAITTIMLAAVVPPLILRLDKYTNGTSGLAIEKPEPPAWLPLSQDAYVYYICLAGVGVAILIMLQLVRGDTGRRLRSVRDNPLIAEAFGVDVARTKVAAFAISAAFGGFAGGLFTLMNAFVSPDSFQLLKSFEFLAGGIIGGITSIAGAFVGALIVVFLPEWSAHISLSMAGIVYGGALVTMMLIAREGVIGLLRTALSWISHRSGAKAHVLEREIAAQDESQLSTSV